LIRRENGSESELWWVCFAPSSPTGLGLLLVSGNVIRC
jgi:hypothetical protein